MPSAPSAGRSSRRDRLRSGRIWPGLLIAALALGLGARALLPWALRHLAVQQIERALDARVEIGDVDVSILGGDVYLEEVRIAPSETPDQPRLMAENVRIRVARRLLLEGRFALAVFGIQGGVAVLERDAEGVLGLGLEGFADEIEEGIDALEEAGSQPGEPFLLARVPVRQFELRIREADDEEIRIRIGHGRLTSLELGKEPGWTFLRFWFEDVEAEFVRGRNRLTLAGRIRGGSVESTLTSQIPIELELHDGDARLHASGMVAPRVPWAQLDLDWEAVDLAAVLDALAPSVSGFAGRAHGEGSVELIPGEPGRGRGELRLRGRMRVEDGAADRPGMDLSWALLEADLAGARLFLASPAGRPVDATAPAPQVRLDRVRIQSPALRWAPGVGSKARVPPSVQIGSLEIDDGVLRWLDFGEAGEELAFSGAKVRAGGVRSPGLRVASLDLAASGPGGGPVRVRGHFGPGDGELVIEGKKLALGPVAGAVAARSPYRIERGQASFRSTVRFEGESYEAPVQLVLHGIGLASADDDAGFLQQFGMRPQLALALLRDSQGDIALDFSVAGSRAGSRVGLWPILGRGIRDAFTNALRKPLSMLGSVVMSDGRLAGFDLAPVPFRAGAGDLETAAAERLARAAEVLGEHTQLRVELVPLLVAEDARALGGNPAPKALRALATARSEAVRRALEAAGIAPERIAVRDGPVALGAGAPRVQLALDADDGS